MYCVCACVRTYTRIHIHTNIVRVFIMYANDDIDDDKTNSGENVKPLILFFSLLLHICLSATDRYVG